MTEYRELYDSLLKSEDLSPEFVGVWEEDKKLFIELQDELEYLAETPLIEDEDDEDSY